MSLFSVVAVELKKKMVEGVLVDLQSAESYGPINPELAQWLRDVIDRVNYYLQNQSEAKKVALQHNAESATLANTLGNFFSTLKSAFPTCPTLARLLTIFGADSQNATHAMTTATRWMRLAPSFSVLLGQPLDASVSAQQLVWDKIQLQLLKFFAENEELCLILSRNPHAFEQLSAFIALATPLMVLKHEDTTTASRKRTVSKSRRGNIVVEELEDGTIIHHRPGSKKVFGPGQETEAEIDARLQ